MIGNRYQIRELLGAGAMGAVYHVIDRLTGQDVALKRVRLPSPNESNTNTITDSQDVKIAISSEFRTLATLHHPNVVNVLDYGFDEHQQPYFTMNLIMDAKTTRGAALGQSIPYKVDLLIQISQALSYIHRRGIIHRDLKPGNVLVTSQNQVKVLDFGVSYEKEATGTNLGNTTVGTLTFMAPELFSDKPASIASDLYALGIIAYEMFAGKHPFSTDNIATLVTSVLHDKPDISLLPRKIAPVIEQLLAKAPTDRYQAADEVIKAFCTAIERPIPKESVAVRESFLQASKFVGRQNELATLRNALNRTRAGKGEAWLIGGESGVGKSRLVEELRIRALVHGAIVLVGQGVENGGLPYQHWREPIRRLLLNADMSIDELSILKEIVPDIDTLLQKEVPDIAELTGVDGQTRLIDTITTLFQRACTTLEDNQLIVVILEDLQWADESLTPLKSLITALENLPILVIGTYREDEHPTLAQQLRNIQIMRLGRLREDEITNLSESILGDVGKQEQIIDLVKRETEGNVFFIIEVVRELAEMAGSLNNIDVSNLPSKIFSGSIQQIIHRRLKQIPQDAKELLKIAAAIGRQLDLDLIELIQNSWRSEVNIRGISLDDWLTLCANNAIIELQDGSWRFSHDKLRESILANLEEEEQPPLYRQVAQAVEALYPDNFDKSVALSEYWRLASNPNKELFYVLLSADNARKINAFRETINFTERALVLLSGSGHLESNKVQRAQFTRQLGEAYGYTGDYDKARTYLKESIRLSKELNDLQGVALAFNTLGDIDQDQGEYTTATIHHNVSLTLFRQVNDLHGIVDALTDLGRTAQGRGEYLEAKIRYQESLAISQDMDDKETIIETLDYLGGAAENQGAYDEARYYFEESLANCRQLGDQSRIANVLDNLGRIAEHQRNYDASQIYYNESLAIYRKHGNSLGSALVLGNLGGIALQQKKYSMAETYTEESLALFRKIDNRLGEALSLNSLGHIALRQEDFKQATEHYREALRICREVGVRGGIASGYNHLGMVAEQVGEHRIAHNYYLQSLEIRREMGDREKIASDLCKIAFTMMELDHAELVRATFSEALNIAYHIGSSSVTLLALAGFAHLNFIDAKYVECAELIGLLTSHPELDNYVNKTRIEPILDLLSEKLSEQQLGKAIQTGHTLKLDLIVADLLPKKTS